MKILSTYEIYYVLDYQMNAVIKKKHSPINKAKFL